MLPRPRSSTLRLSLAALSLAVATPFLVPTSGCSGGFDPPGKVNGLRVLAITADKPYANPGDDVTFDMTVYDGLVSGETADGPRPVQITWLGGCFNPIGDEYYGCYAPLGELLQQLATGQVPPTGLVAQGVGLNQFTLSIPDDILTGRPQPEIGVRYGIAYLFFAACAGQVRPVAAEGTSDAGSFPLGCFDENGTRLGPDSFVPGYTQVYVFEDGRTNANPQITALTLDGNPLPEDLSAIPTVKACAVSEEDRRTAGCGTEDPFASCQAYAIDTTVPADAAEIDPDATDADGNVLRETLWIDYFADRGDFDSDIKLVNDAVKGPVSDRQVKWIAPPEPGLATLWAVLRDARGGSSIVTRYVRVE